jgi:hypothetical protein
MRQTFFRQNRRKKVFLEKKFFSRNVLIGRTPQRLLTSFGLSVDTVQGCQIFLGKTGKIYQMTTKLTIWP